MIPHGYLDDLFTPTSSIVKDRKARGSLHCMTMAAKSSRLVLHEDGSEDEPDKNLESNFVQQHYISSHVITNVISECC